MNLVKNYFKNGLRSVQFFFQFIIQIVPFQIQGHKNGVVIHINLEIVIIVKKKNTQGIGVSM